MQVSFNMAVDDDEVLRARTLCYHTEKAPLVSLLGVNGTLTRSGHRINAGIQINHEVSVNFQATVRVSAPGNRHEICTTAH